MLGIFHLTLPSIPDLLVCFNFHPNNIKVDPKNVGNLLLPDSNEGTMNCEADTLFIDPAGNPDPPCTKT